MMLGIRRKRIKINMFSTSTGEFRILLLDDRVKYNNCVIKCPTRLGQNTALDKVTHWPHNFTEVNKY